jgi:hypothetical protein
MHVFLIQAFSARFQVNRIGKSVDSPWPKNFTTANFHNNFRKMKRGNTLVNGKNLPCGATVLPQAILIRAIDMTDMNIGAYATGLSCYNAIEQYGYDCASGPG